MPWYKSGTVSVVLNSNAVIGTGTAFIANSRVGDAFRGPDGGWYEVTNIASDTALSISPNYQGASNAAGTYALAPMQGYVKDSADTLRSFVNLYGVKLSALGTTGNYDILPVTKGGTGGVTQAAAHTGLGLGTAAVADLTTSYADVTQGRGMKVGCCGIGLPTAIVNVDAELPTGTYQAASSGGGTYPAGFNSGSVIVSQRNVTPYRGNQILESDADGRMWRRANNSVWTTWIELVYAGANSTITSLSGLSTALSVAQGGTGASTASAALASLGAMPLAGSSVDVSFKSMRASGAAANLATQGGYLAWNTAAGGLTGEMAFICNQGGGSGGFSWRSVNSANTATGPTMTYTYAGVLNVPGAVNQNSDRRLKTNDIEIVDGLERIMRIRPVEYDRRDSFESEEYTHHEVGVIAQELFEVAPLLVTPANPDSAEDIWRVNYTGLIPYLVSAIKTLKAEIEDLKAATQ